MPATLPDRLRALAAEPAARLDELTEMVWASADAESLELCRLRIASLLGHADGVARRTPAAAGLDPAKIAAVGEWWTAECFTPAEQARLAFTEQFVWSVSSMPADDVEALLTYDDEEAVYQFVTAIYVLDMTTRIELVTGAIFDLDAVSP